MHLSHHVTIAAMPVAGIGPIVSREAGDPRGELDARWPSVRGVLHRLRAARRRSVRIVDLDCGAGELLLHAARAARSLGFVSVEVRGVGREQRSVARARRAANALADRGVGATFDIEAPATVLAEEADLPADLILCAAQQAEDPALMRAAALAGRTLVAASPAHGRRRAA